MIALGDGRYLRLCGRCRHEHCREAEDNVDTQFGLRNHLCRFSCVLFWEGDGEWMGRIVILDWKEENYGRR